MEELLKIDAFFNKPRYDHEIISFTSNIISSLTFHDDAFSGFFTGKPEQFDSKKLEETNKYLEIRSYLFKKEIEFRERKANIISS